MQEYKKGQVWDKPLTSDMKLFESETNKKAVFRNKITGQFEYWLYKRNSQIFKKYAKNLNIVKSKEIELSKLNQLPATKENKQKIREKVGEITRIEKNQKSVEEQIDELYKYFTVKEMAKALYNITNEIQIIKYLYQSGKITADQRDNLIGADRLCKINTRLWDIETSKNKNERINYNLAIELKYPKYIKSMIAHVRDDFNDMDIDFEKYNVNDNDYMLLYSKQIDMNEIPRQIILHNQRLLKRYGTSIALYKGMATVSYTNRNSQSILYSILKGTSKHCVSWTDKRSIAIDWANDGTDGIVITCKIPISKILISYHGSEILKDMGEHEYIVKPFNIEKIAKYHKLK